MPELFPRRRFTALGPSAVALPGEDLTTTTIEGCRPGKLRAYVSATCLRRPGAYGMIDAAGELIYVGKAKSLRSRLLSYFRSKSRDRKAGRIIRQTRSIVWEPHASEFAALLRELELIRRWRPRWNVQGQPHNRLRYFVCIGRRPAPYVFLSTKTTSTVESWHGPVPAGDRAREAVRRLNDHFKLRDCPQTQPMVFRDQPELFPTPRAAGCIRYDLGKCLGPCAAKCTTREYEQAVDGVKRFLDGTNDEPLRFLDQELLSASAALRFERAASLRDQHEHLTWLRQHLQRLEQARRLSFVYAVESRDAEPRWYLIHRGDLKGVRRAPASNDQSGDLIATLRDVYEDSPGIVGGKLAEQIERSMLIASWFRRSPEQLQFTFDPTQRLAG